ncbi:hypothetical protein FGB62_80g05 [Gracilaria domingensis]|nr:hypothetical protein FGB62_80g05 [Gracilaria domingensis]
MYSRALIQQSKFVFIIAMYLKYLCSIMQIASFTLFPALPSSLGMKEFESALVAAGRSNFCQISDALERLAKEQLDRFRTHELPNVSHERSEGTVRT